MSYRASLGIFSACLIFAILDFFQVTVQAAQEIHVAVASNFRSPIIKIAEKFETRTGHKITLIFGSTGKLYAQIVNRAPFDAFFAADTRRPEILEENEIAVTGSRFTYAVGRLVLWSSKSGYVDSAGNILKTGRFRYLALANPKLAPYGLAAEEVLRGFGIWGQLQDRIVRGENINQAFHFIKSRNAELGFIAYSQLMELNEGESGSFWLVPQNLYTRIEQQAVLLNRKSVGRAFLDFVRSNEAREIIRHFGYDTP